MNKRIDWNRKHTLILVFLLLFVTALYVLGYQRVIAPLTDDASLVQAPPQAVNAAAIPDAAVQDIGAFVTPSAERSGVSVLSADILAQDIVSPVEGVTGTSYTVQVTAGDAQSLHAFVYALTRSTRYVQVDSIRLSEPEGVRQLDLVITLYHKS